MESVCKELDEVKLELEKIKDDNRIKSGDLENLKKANADQSVRYQEVKLQMEKLAQELSKKEGEVAESRHLYEDVKCRLRETESSLKHANAVNEKLRVDCGEKVQRLEEENRKLVSDLDEANFKMNELEGRLCECCQEVAGLKLQLADSERKCLEAEQKIELKKALSNRDDAIRKLEEECSGLQDRLKWKLEQFEHLEEAHKLLQEHFQSSKREWESEKTSLLQEIASLQLRLDTQVRMNESLQSELKMCNQALAHEESRRRAVEIELSESIASFENVMGEFNEAKSKMEVLSMERDEKLASLRNALGTKNAHVKELEYRMSHLEQDNKELLSSVKELQEAQIGRKKPDSSSIKLRNKLRDLEQAHSRCSVIMEEKEAEWNLKMEKMMERFTRCELDLKTKTEEINQLKMQVEYCQSSIDTSAEEISILLMVLKSGYAEVYSEMLDLKLESGMRKEESGVQETEIESQLKAQFHLDQAREEIALMSKKLENLKTVESKNALLENELEKYRQMLDESSRRQLLLEEHAAVMEASAKQMREEVVDLQREKDQLANEWKRAESLASSEIEKLKQELEKLYVIVEGKDQSTRDLQGAVLSMEQDYIDETVLAFSEAFELLSRNGALREAVEKAEKMITTEVQESASLRSKIGHVEELLVSSQNRERNLESLLEHRMLEIDDVNGDLRDMQDKYKELEKQVEDKKILVSALEKESSDLHSKIADFEESVLNSRSRERELEALLENKTMEMGSLNDNLSNIQEKYIKVETEVQEKKDLVSALEISLISSQNREQELEAFLKQKKQEVDSLKVDLGEVQGKYEKEAEEKKNLVSASEKESSDLHSKIADFEESLLNSRSRERELEALLENKTMEMGSLNDNLSNIQEKYIKVETEVQEKKDLVSALENSLISSQNREQELEAFLKQKKQEVDSLKVDLGEVKGKYEKEAEEKKNLVSASEKESSDLHSKIADFEESLLNSRSRERELEALLENKTMEMGSLNDNLSNIQEKYIKVETEVQEKKDLVSALENSLISSQNREQELEAFLKQKKQEVDSLKVDLGEVKGKYEKEAEEKKNLVSALENSLITSQNREQELEAFIKQKKQEVDSLKVNLGEVQGKYEKEAEEKKNLVSGLEKKSADLRAKLLQAEGSLLDSQNREKDLEASIKQKTSEMNSLKGDIVQLQLKYEKEVEERKNLVTALEKKSADSQNRERELEALMVDLGKLQGKYKKAKNELEEKNSLNSALEKESANLRSQIVQTESSLINLRNTGRKLEALLDHKTAELNNLKAELDNVNKNYKNVKKESADQRSRIAHAEESLQNSITKLKEMELLANSLKDDHMNAAMKWASEKESLVSWVDAELGGFCEEDAVLMAMLDKILGQCEEDGMKRRDVKGESFCSKGKVKGGLERRGSVCPLRELN